MLECTVDRKELLGALAFTGKVINSRATLPILSNVLLQLDEARGLVITCTDLEVYASRRIPTSGEGGQTTVNHKELTRLLKAMADDEVTLRADDRDHFTITGKKLTVTINGLPADEFPTAMMVDRPHLATVGDGAALADAVNRVVVATWTSDTINHQRLQGVYFEAAEGTLHVVASDTHRLSEARVDCTSDGFSAIIPAKATKLLPDVLKNGCWIKGTLDPAPTEYPWLVFATNDGLNVVRCRCVEGEFPCWRKVVPRSAEHVVTLKTSDLRDAVRAVQPVVAQLKEQKILVTFAPGGVTVAAHNGALSSAETSFEADVDFNGFIYLDAQFLLDGLVDDEVELWYSSENQPIILRQRHDYVLGGIG